jgi:Domain of unknown function (DUF4178)
MVALKILRKRLWKLSYYMAVRPFERRASWYSKCSILKDENKLCLAHPIFIRSYMTEILTDGQLNTLREGDRLTYFGVRWQVKDYSTYTDPKGYEVEEWLIQSTTGKTYYLLREVDPADLATDVHWYIAEELTAPKLLDPGTQSDVLTTVAARMRSHGEPYPSLQLFNRQYRFESETEGIYESDTGPRDRITWDYWDTAHLWNMALEAWSDHKLSVYSTREVQPEDFSELRKGSEGNPLSSARESAFARQTKTQSSGGISRQNQLLMAWGLVIVGFFLLMAGV